MIKDVSQALEVAHLFVVWDTRGLSGEIGSFNPIKAVHDESKNIWVVECKFKRKGENRSAKIIIDANTGTVKSYESI